MNELLELDIALDPWLKDPDNRRAIPEDARLVCIHELHLGVDSVPHLGTSLFEVSVNPADGKIWVPNTDARNFVRFAHPLGLRGHLVDNRMSVVNPAAGNATNLANVCYLSSWVGAVDFDFENQFMYWTVPIGSRELRRAPIPPDAAQPVDLSTGGFTVFATETSGIRNFFGDTLSVSPELGVVVWVSFSNELSWKPIKSLPTDANRRSATFAARPDGSLEVVPGPWVHLRIPWLR